MSERSTSAGTQRPEEISQRYRPFDASSVCKLVGRYLRPRNRRPCTIVARYPRGPCRLMPVLAYFSMTEPPSLKPVEWMGSSLDDLRDFPDAVKDEVGYALYVAQRGDHPPQAKRLKGELGGLVELVADFDGNTYRVVYTVKLRGVVYVLHVFQKKSTRGIATPRHAITLMRERYARAREHHAAHYGTPED